MSEVSWDVFGEGPTIRVVQVASGIMLYEEAKTYAADKLRVLSQPLQQRLAEIENDIDKERNKMPRCKAWECDYTYRGLKEKVVVARTKKRAAELVRYSPSSFGRLYRLFEGFWWYHLAQDEGLWERERQNYRDEWGEWHRPKREENE